MSKQRPDFPPPTPPLPGDKKPVSAPPEPKPRPKLKPKAPSPWPWGRFTRIAVSLLVAFHLVAVFTAPWFIQLRSSVVPMVEPGGIPRGADGRAVPPNQMGNFPAQRPLLPELLAKSLRHYQNLLYINNGYDFFSPDPGVSHLIRYQVFDENDQKIAEGQMPDRREQWPRLFYHRHMMLVEQSADPLFASAGWEFKIADRLLEAHNGSRVRLEQVRHHLLTPEEVKAGRRINEESTYEGLAFLDHRRAAKAPAQSGEPPVSVPGGAR